MAGLAKFIGAFLLYIFFFFSFSNQDFKLEQVLSKYLLKVGRRLVFRQQNADFFIRPTIERQI